MVIASLIVFVIVRLVPGAASSTAGCSVRQNDVGADKLSRDQLINTLGLDRPIVGSNTREGGSGGYFCLHGDFGPLALAEHPRSAELLRCAHAGSRSSSGWMAMIVALWRAIPIGNLLGDPARTPPATTSHVRSRS